MNGSTAWIVWAVVAGLLLLVLVIYVLVGPGGREILERRALQRALWTKVRDVMSRPVVVAKEDLTVGEAAAIMLDRDIGCLPVVDKTGSLMGIVTESDLTGMKAPLVFAASRKGLIGEWVRAEGAERSYEDARKKTVREVMTTRVVTAMEDEPISDVIVRMMDQDLHHLPVIENGIPVGVVARHDLLSLLAKRSR
jgi:CBS-domain-containing membrane protein